ncbi:unnamed protein product [Cochlearia groenlandica]
MSNPPRLTDHRSPKRPRFPPIDEIEEEEEDDDYYATSASVSHEEDEDDEESSADEEEEEEEDEGGDIAAAEDVGGGGGTRNATISNGCSEDATRSVSSSPISSSSPSSQSVKLKNSDVLDCPTCCEPLKRPIYQCTNGHLACSSCCTKLMKRCPFCRSHIGDIRCRAMEKVIESSIVPCRNSIYGCKETTTYGNQQTHEKYCVFARCSCPLLNCNYSGPFSALESHVRGSAHSRDEDSIIPFDVDKPVIFGMNLAKKKTAVLQEQKLGFLVVVQATKGPPGVYVTVSSIAPMTPGVRSLSCNLGKLSAYTTLRLGLMVKNIQKVVAAQEVPEDGFMLIPTYMLCGDHLKMQICIGSELKYVHI